MNNIKTNALFFVPVALIFMAYAALSFISPEDLIQWLTRFYELDQDREKLLPTYIHDASWLKLKVTMSVLLLWILYLFYDDKKIGMEYKISFYTFFHWLKKDWLDFTKTERMMVLLVLGCFTGVIMYYSAITPVQLDELHSWLFFIDRGPLITAAYYPASNNHIAYNLLSIPWNFFLPPVWALRMVSLLSAIGAVGLFVVVLRQRYSFIFSVSGMVLLMSSACFSWYAVQGRGYVLELFLLVVILYVLLRSSIDFVADRLLVPLNALTMYCLPVAAIPLALLNIYYAYRVINSDQNGIKRIIRTGGYSMLLTFLCYLPVFVFSGFDSLLNNPFVQRVSYGEAFTAGTTKYLPALWDFISGTEGYVSSAVLLVLLTGTVLLALRKSRRVLIPCLILFLPFVLLQAYPVLLFDRTWLWLVVPYIYWCLEVACFFTCKKKWYTLMIASAFAAAVIVMNVMRSYTTNQLLVANARQFYELQNAMDLRLSGKTVGVSDDVVYDYLFFHQKTFKAYTLIYVTPETTVIPDVLVKSRNEFSSSEGQVIWMNPEYVVYRVDSNI